MEEKGLPREYMRLQREQGVTVKLTMRGGNITRIQDEFYFGLNDVETTSPTRQQQSPTAQQPQSTSEQQQQSLPTQQQQSSPVQETKLDSDHNDDSDSGDSDSGDSEITVVAIKQQQSQQQSQQQPSYEQTASILDELD